MSTEELEQALRALHGGGSVAEVASRRDQALATFRRLRGESKARRPGFAMPRWVLASAAALALSIGACAMPTSYDVDLGVGVRVNFEASQRDALMAELEEIGRFCRIELGADDITVEFSYTEERAGDGAGAAEPAGRLELRVWGRELVPDEVVPRLRERFASLQGLELEESALSGELRTRVGIRLWHEWLGGLEREGDIEEARARLMAELAARGIEGEVEVEIQRIEFDEAFDEGLDEGLEEETGAGGEIGEGARSGRRVRILRREVRDERGPELVSDAEVEADAGDKAPGASRDSEEQVVIERRILGPGGG